MSEPNAVEKDLIELAKRHGAASAGVGTRQDELPQRWIARWLGLPKQYVPTLLFTAHFPVQFDGRRIATEIDNVCRKHDVRIEWQMLKLVWGDRKALRAGN